MLEWQAWLEAREMLLQCCNAAVVSQYWPAPAHFQVQAVASPPSVCAPAPGCRLCTKRIHVTKRDLFYTDVKLFEVCF